MFSSYSEKKRETDMPHIESTTFFLLEDLIVSVFNLLDRVY